jgi:hypothetical protein
LLPKLHFLHFGLSQSQHLLLVLGFVYQYSPLLQELDGFGVDYVELEVEFEVVLEVVEFEVELESVEFEVELE